MTSTAVRTGSILGDFSFLDAVADDQERTAMSARVADPGLRDALRRFDCAELSTRQPLPSLTMLAGQHRSIVWSGALAEMSRGAQWQFVLDVNLSQQFDLTVVLPGFTGNALSAEVSSVEPVSSGQESVVSAVARLGRVLGMPQRRVLDAAGIRKSTFFHWKRNPATQPRVDSLARLWELSDCVSELQEIIGDGLASWFAARPAARRELAHGDFDSLLARASRERYPYPERPASLESTGTAFAAAIGPEDDAPLFGSAPAFERGAAPARHGSAIQVARRVPRER
ncbi:hypothetical protein [Cellulomonas sp. NPDC058312]|uniref:hypothetical protein n=1 Tax=Cellulomonas sp. NPDC058312 TaxID=3346441 RepID=UPI0036E279DC